MRSESVTVCRGYCASGSYRGKAATTGQIIGVVCKRRKLKVNLGKNKVIVSSRESRQAELKVHLNGQK